MASVRRISEAMLRRFAVAALSAVLCSCFLFPAFCEVADKSAEFVSKKSKKDGFCFCQLKGHVDDCSCDVNTVDRFNNEKVFPRLQSLLAKDFFRYFEYNPNKPCIFFSEEVSASDKCTSRRCGVKRCEADELPPGLRQQQQQEESSCDARSGGGGDVVDDTLTDSAKKDIESWRDHDAAKNDGFCDVDGGQSCQDCVHVDLTLNPERFTGYKGEAAHKIWRTIYEENCFRPPASSGNEGLGTMKTTTTTTASVAARRKLFFVPQEQLQQLCLEKRAFYRAVSGLHASITIHLSARHPVKRKKGGSDLLSGPPSAPFAGTNLDPSESFGPNLELFLSRFDAEKTEGQGPFWLKNLYFVYLLELRAILKAKPFLEGQKFYTGNAQEDKDTGIAVRELLGVVEAFPDHFDETTLFSNGAKESNERLKEEFREHFLNVSRVMDCVSCDKCKLWGKLQVTGLGTALKILLASQHRPPRLNRNEVVALFNAFGRISTSIQQLENFRAQLRT